MKTEKPEFQNRTILITGASSGIGRATAVAFARGGANVLIADIDSRMGEEATAISKKMGGKVVFQRCDVSKENDVRQAVERTLSEFGHLHYAFNNAGIEGDQAPTAECSVENWDHVLSVNLKGVWLCMKYEIQAMLKEESGVIVNCSSIAGLVGFENTPAYVASKHGVIGLTKAAALELAKSHVRVNAVCPGVIQTPMIDRFASSAPEFREALIAQEPVGRMGQPEEIADAVMWLCSQRATFVTGQAIAIDGGWTAR